ncbi:MAG: beta-Ala-His dipeptidase, partial [Bacteroidales bacterium]|nr:beta-Ala-His dipeptidase [Bacteroidales bacterium]
MSEIRNLKPEPLWNYFADICEIPHPSKKESKMVEYVKKFGEDLGLETIVDAVGNVVIRKPATPGYENRMGVVLQSHLDMVPQKNSDKKHDFEKDPIVAMVDGEWVTADGTTLGADNGMGVAAIMSVLADGDLKHGPLEGLFTIDEETGMTGAFALKGGVLKSDILINLDSEDEGELYVGCAGGVDVSAKMNYKDEKMPSGYVAYRITARGMKGGHSGIDIPLGRANANKIIFRFLMQAEADLKIRLAEAKAGDLRNAIPREGYAIVAVESDKASGFEKLVKEYDVIYKAEFDDTEPEISFTCEKTKEPAGLLPADVQYRIMRAVYACP